MRALCPLQVKPVRDSIAEALLVWKKVGGKGEDGEEDKGSFNS